jgi:hypothetical protein
VLSPDDDPGFVAIVVVQIGGEFLALRREIIDSIGAVWELLVFVDVLVIDYQQTSLLLVVAQRQFHSFPRCLGYVGRLRYL